MAHAELAGIFGRSQSSRLGSTCHLSGECPSLLEAASSTKCLLIWLRLVCGFAAGNNPVILSGQVGIVTITPCCVTLYVVAIFFRCGELFAESDRVDMVLTPAIPLCLMHDLVHNVSIPCKHRTALWYTLCNRHDSQACQEPFVCFLQGVCFRCTHMLLCWRSHASL